MNKTSIPVLKPGESATLRFIVKVVDFDAMNKRCNKWWHLWHPIIYRDATEDDFKPTQEGK